MPNGIFTQFIVEINQYIDQKEYICKTGVILKRYNTRAEVTENYNKQEIRIRIVGENKQKLITFFNKKKISSIHDFSVNWNQLQLIESNYIIANLLFESFNKTFKIIEKNKELLDCFAYYFLCTEILYDFEIIHFVKNYLILKKFNKN